MNAGKGSSVLPVVANGTSAHIVAANGTHVASAIAKKSFSLWSAENETSVIDGVIDSSVIEGVIYSSEVERVLSLLFIGLSTVLTLCAQLLVLVTIVKSPKLHNAHYYLLAMYCCVDITLLSVTGPAFITRFSNRNVALSNCEFVSSVATICLMGQIAHNTVVACERYTYFCHPFHYEQQFSTARIVVILGMCYAIPATIVATQGAIFSFSFHASSLSCWISSIWIERYPFLVISVLSSIAVTVYCMIRVWRLSRRAAVSPGAQVNQQNQSTPVQQAHKTLKMMLLLSSTFWATTLPAIVGKIIIFSTDYTLEDLDTRRYVVPSIIMRLAVFTHCFISSTANPFIYYYSRRDLRLAMCQLLQWNSNTLQPEIYPMS